MEEREAHAQPLVGARGAPPMVVRPEICPAASSLPCASNPGGRLSFGCLLPPQQRKQSRVYSVLCGFFFFFAYVLH